ncbi:MAG: hypothetical protein WC666_04270 [Candidatus Paceibacterota bacterium]|jgi:hypothetical protein
METMRHHTIQDFILKTFIQLIVNLMGPEDSQWKEELEKFIKKEPCWVKSQVVVQAPIIEPNLPIPDTTTAIKTDVAVEAVVAIIIPAISYKFVVKDNFVCNPDPNADIKIGRLGEGFVKRFLSDSGKIEDPIGEQTLEYFDLQRSMTSNSILKEFGGREKLEMTLFGVFALITNQGKGEPGVLISNGCPNIFFVRDQANELCVVGVNLSSKGWEVGALALNDSDTHDAGCRVFSRASAVTLIEEEKPSEITPVTSSV